MAIDPSGPTEPLNPREPRRILRGGMCGDEVCQVFCRNAYRLGAWEQWGGDVVGFRVVADIEQRDYADDGYVQVERTLRSWGKWEGEAAARRWRPA